MDIKSSIVLDFRSSCNADGSTYAALSWNNMIIFDLPIEDVPIITLCCVSTFVLVPTFVALHKGSNWWRASMGLLTTIWSGRHAHGVCVRLPFCMVFILGMIVSIDYRVGLFYFVCMFWCAGYLELQSRMQTLVFGLSYLWDWDHFKVLKSGATMTITV